MWKMMEGKCAKKCTKVAEKLIKNCSANQQIVRKVGGRWRITELCANIIGSSHMCAFYEKLNLAPS
jgi:hypothetical protein